MSKYVPKNLPRNHSERFCYSNPVSHMRGLTVKHGSKRKRDKDRGG